jgi:hypothetical protein
MMMMMMMKRRRRKKKRKMTMIKRKRKMMRIKSEYGGLGEPAIGGELIAPKNQKSCVCVAAKEEGNRNKVRQR